MHDRVKKMRKPEVADEEILEEVSEEVEAQEELEGRLAEKMHRVNVRFPWLKILTVILLLAGVAGGILAALYHGDVVDVADEVQVSENEGETKVEEEVGKDVDSKEQEEPKAGETEKEEQKTPEAEEKTEVTKPETPTYVVPQNTGRKVVALTFDDGPSAANTPRLLDILAAKRVKATFFVLGTMAQRSPDLIKREVAEGHEVESHTMSHLSLTKLSGATIQGEVAGVDAILQELIGRPANLVRPPYGAINNTVRENVGKPLIIWTVDPEDWKYRDGPTVRAKVVSKTFDGAIVLMHDIHSTTIDAVAGVIDDLRAAGYEFLTVSEMAAERGVVLQNGYSYGRF